MTRYFFLLLGIFAATHALDRCGTSEPSTELHASHARLASTESNDRQSPNYYHGTVIDTYIHIISNGSTLKDGNIPDSQIDIINIGYALSGFQFVLRNTTRTTNLQWQLIQEQTTNELNMKKALRQGGYNALNIYLTTLDFDLLGYAYFPLKNGNEDSFWRDGVVADFRSVPGGSFLPRFGEGKTVTHEAGHWFGLFHTFQGGCVDPGDHVADTPYESSPAFGCPVGRDTCPSPGTDPVHNYMDYGDDPCMTEFTPDQITRLHSLWNEFRAPKPVPEPVPKSGDGSTAAGRSVDEGYGERVPLIIRNWPVS